jgi:hypothetical protein
MLAGLIRLIKNPGYEVIVAKLFDKERVLMKSPPNVDNVHLPNRSNIIVNVQTPTTAGFADS